MTFPYPQNSSDWQTAYMRDHAYHEYGKHVRNAEIALILGIAVISAFVAIQVAPTISQILSRLLPPTTSPVVKIIILFVMMVAYILAAYLLLMFVQAKAMQFAVQFFADFYQPPDGIEPAKIIDYRLHGRFKLPPPFTMLSQFKYILVKDGEIIKGPAWVARNLGGPIMLIIFDGCALYLERGNRFSRVVGPGDKIPFLEWYETIKYVVDLRPKIQEGEIQVWTKDGINVTMKIKIECRIGDPKHNPPAANLIYPYDPDAVRKAVERYAVRWPTCPEGDPSEFTWIDAAWGQVTGIVPDYIGRRMLDDLFIADRNGGQILSPDAVQEIFGKLNNATNQFGVYVTDFQVLKIELPSEVEEHQKEFWKAEKQSFATRVGGEAKAFSIRAREKARADAQYSIILAIAEGLEKNKDRQFTEPVLLSLSGVLDESLSEPLTRAYLANQTLETLDQLRKLLDQK